MKKMTKKAFTLVELIVAVTILAIIGTIGFISYSGYLSSVRDTNRISQLVAISEGLKLYSSEKNLPLPDNYVTVKSNGAVIGYQGYAGSDVLETIGYSKKGQDPKDKTYFSYYITKSRKYHQLMAFLEEEENLQTSLNIIPTTYAADYTNRYQAVSGNPLGILTQTGTNIPIQEIPSIVTATELDVATTADEYVATLKNGDTFSGDGTALWKLEQVMKLGGQGFSAENNEIIYIDPYHSIPRDGLILELLFEDDLQDNSTNQNHANPYGDPSFVTGKIGQALYCDGNDYIISPNSSTIQDQGDIFAWSFWFKGGDQVETYSRLLQIGDTVVSVGNTQSHRMRSWIKTDARSGTLMSTASMNDNIWHHIVFQWDGTTVSLYIDGTLAGTTSKTGTLNSITSADFRVCYSPKYEGYIDNVRVYNRILNESEINSLRYEWN